MNTSNSTQSAERNATILRIAIFSVLVTALAWIAPLLGGSPTSPGLGFFIWAMAPLLASIVLRVVTRDWSDLGAKPNIRKYIRWYVISLLAYPVCMVLAVVSGVLTSVSSITEFSMAQYLQIAVTALPFFLIFAIFEEVGWRGYLAPKLASLGINNYIAAVLVAAVWASWHIPYIRELTWDYTSENLLTFIPRFYLACFAFSIVFGEIRNRTATFWPAVVMHGVGNAFGHPLAAEFVTIAPGMEYLGSVGNGLFMIAFMLLLGIAVNRWRLRKASLSQVLVG